MTQLFFLKRDLTGPNGTVRHYRVDLINNVIEELIQHQLLHHGGD